MRPISDTLGKTKNDLMLKRIARVCRKALSRRASGAALIEVVIAVVVLGLITASVPPVLVLITDAEFRRNEQKVAESLTRNVIEYIKSAPYIDGPDPEYLTEEKEKQLIPNESYDIVVIAQPISVDPLTREHKPLCDDCPDEGIQEITVSVKHVDRLVVESKNYKVDR